MPPKKPNDPKHEPPPLVAVVYHGSVERRYTDPATGLDYLFYPGARTLVPPELARGLLDSAPDSYALQEA